MGNRKYRKMLQDMIPQCRKDATIAQQCQEMMVSFLGKRNNMTLALMVENMGPSEFLRYIDPIPSNKKGR